MNVEDGDGVLLFESERWGGWKFYKQIAPTIKANKVSAGVVEMTTEERIDEMNRQYLTTRSLKKRRDLKKGIEKAERKRRREKLEREGTIVI